MILVVTTLATAVVAVDSPTNGLQRRMKPESKLLQPVLLIVAPPSVQWLGDGGAY